jgi:hypothetical protein
MFCLYTLALLLLLFFLSIIYVTFYGSYCCVRFINAKRYQEELGLLILGFNRKDSRKKELTKEKSLILNCRKNKNYKE